MERKISTKLGIVILIVSSVAGILVWQWWLVQKEKLETSVDMGIQKEDISCLFNEKKLATIPEDYIKGLEGIYSSSDGKHFAYKVQTEDLKEFVVIDGKKGKEYDKIIGETFSPNGEHFAFLAEGVGMGVFDVFVVADGKEIRKYHSPRTLVYSPDSTKLVYVAEKNNKEFVVVNHEKNGKEYDNIAKPSFSYDGTKFGYAAEREGKWFIIVNDQEIQGPYDYDVISHIAISPDGEQVAYEVLKGKNQFIAINGKKVSKNYFYYAEGPIFSPDGKKFAYIGQKEGKKIPWVGPKSVVVNGKEGKEYALIFDLTFSPDSKHMAYVASKTTQNAKYFVVIDGKEGKESYDMIGVPYFDPNSKCVGYIAKIGNELWWKVEKIK